MRNDSQKIVGKKIENELRELNHQLLLKILKSWADGQMASVEIGPRFALFFATVQYAYCMRTSSLPLISIDFS